MKKEDKELMISALKEKVKNPCSCCGSSDFEIAGQAIIALQEDFAKMKLFCPESIPCGIAVCRKCGFIALHAFACLGMMPKEATWESI